MNHKTPQPRPNSTIDQKKKRKKISSQLPIISKARNSTLTIIRTRIQSQPVNWNWNKSPTINITKPKIWPDQQERSHSNFHSNQWRFSIKMRRFSEKIRYGRLGDPNENDALPRSSLSPAAGGDTERPRKFLKNKNEKKKRKKKKKNIILWAVSFLFYYLFNYYYF